MRIGRWMAIVIVAAVAAGAGAIYWRSVTRDALPEGFARTNGRIEAEQIDIATKIAGRLADITVEEGDMVEAGQMVARLDDVQIRAQLAAAEAEHRRAIQAKAEAEAQLAYRRSELVYARAELSRGETLAARGHFTREGVDQRRMQVATAQAAEAAAMAAVDQAAAAIDAAAAQVAQTRAILDDTVLTAPRAGRIQYRLAVPGEVLAAGGRIATLLDLTDVQMTIFLPARDAGRLATGAEARLILDPIPEYVVPAAVSFVAGEAQFTPKSVETREERDTLMFRVKLRIPADLLAAHADRVKTGVRGTAVVRVDPAAPWPAELAVKLP
ncbi:HlyD family secretion protein [Tistrella mobilis]|uniref:HlyD family secretion protein n=1 Tax=Tistrella mobilis (strain KA081020-065) TaxID=1110502 RepID=I3TRD0_TISMK|nr:HlyD family efflux transporter periplasmic adaptor subunit [Tistrella mobilis]AFK55318.1 HlyD family secretion protein [Tistrella mobilis KA081020-065]